MTNTNAAHVATFFDRVATFYDNVVINARYIVPTWLRQRLVDHPREVAWHVLDLACANGSNLRILKEYFTCVYAIGVDVSPEMIRAAQEANLYEQLYLHDLDQPMGFLSSAQFDLVLALGFSEFLVQPQVCLSEIQRLLKQHGQLFISFQEHIPADPQAPRSARNGAVAYNAYTQAEVRRLLQQHNLMIMTQVSVTGYISEFDDACPYLLVQCQKV